MSTHRQLASILTVIVLACPIVPTETAAADQQKQDKSPLSWDHESLHLTVPAGATSAEGWFVFTNTSKDPVRILKVESDCDCVVTQTDLIVYYPGESGVLVATVEVRPDQSVVDKSIKVAFQKKTEQPRVHVLRLMAVRKSAKNQPANDQIIPGSGSANGQDPAAKN